MIGINFKLDGRELLHIRVLGYTGIISVPIGEKFVAIGETFTPKTVGEDVSADDFYDDEEVVVDPNAAPVHIDVVYTARDGDTRPSIVIGLPDEAIRDDYTMGGDLSRLYSSEALNLLDLSVARANANGEYYAMQSEHVLDKLHKFHRHKIEPYAVYPLE